MQAANQYAAVTAREAFFRKVVNPVQFLQPLEQIPGVHYFLRDTESRVIAMNRAAVKWLGFKSEEELLGKLPHEYLPKEIAEKHMADDQSVISSGRPLLNLVEPGFDERGHKSWVLTNKFPLRDPEGKVIGIVGMIQSLDGRKRSKGRLEMVRKAVDLIRTGLGNRLRLSEVAGEAGVSERQLQRLFRAVFGLTVQKFIIQSRIHGAAHDLTHTTRPISEIAEAYGFSDQSAFSNKFRDVTGCTPRRYRSQFSLPSIVAAPAPARI